MIKKIGLLCVLLGSFFTLNGEAVVLLETASTDSRLFIVDRSRLTETGNVQRKFVEQHPLAFLYEYHEVKLPNGTAGFLRRDVVPRADGKGVELIPEIPVKFLTFGTLTTLALAFIVLRGLKRNFKEWELLMIPVLLRILPAIIIVCKWNNAFTIAADENGYFEVAKALLAGNWHGQWKFTIGNALLYIPFILATGAEKFYDIVPYYNYFSLFVFGPGVLVAGYLILRKLDVSAKRACVFMAIWAILPFVLFHSEEWTACKFQHFFLHTQLFTRFVRLAFYGFCINSGYNAMSDMPGLLAVLWCIYLTLAMPGKKRYAALAGALFGFSCLIRINYIILSPLFAFLLYRKFAFERKILWQAALASVGGFLLVFGIQLIANTIQFGAPFTFGYILHYPEYAELDRPAAGFTWHTFAQLKYVKYLLQVNLPVFAIGTAALWTMRDKFKLTVFTLAAIPLILFFCGYSHTFCDGRRFVFPAFAALWLATAAADFRKRLSGREEIEIFIALLLMVTIGLPCEAPWKTFPLMLGDDLIMRILRAAIPIYLTILALRLLRKGKIAALIFITLSAVFYYSPSMVLGIAMLLLPAAVGLSWLIPVKSKLNLCRKVLRTSYQKFQ